MATQPLISSLGEILTEVRPQESQPTGAQELSQGLGSITTYIYKFGRGATVRPFRELLSEMPFEANVADTIRSTSGIDASSVRDWWSRGVISEIDALLAGSEDEVAPTRHAYERARSVVEAAYGELDRLRGKKRRGVPEIFPKPLVTTDDVGGIRLSWRMGSKQVRANFGARPELQSYVYFESGLEHNAEDLDVEHLAGRLAWLTAD